MNHTFVNEMAVIIRKYSLKYTENVCVSFLIQIFENILLDSGNTLPSDMGWHHASRDYFGQNNVLTVTSIWTCYFEGFVYILKIG